MKKSIAAITIAFSTLSPMAFASKQNLKTNPLIAAVVQTEEQIEIWINTRENWRDEGALTDSYSEDIQILVDQITDATKLCNLMESVYEPCREGRTILQIKKDLMRVGVEIDPDFQKWAENEIKD